ncbi:MAG TPA: LuxR C-terminal-related transcriptional regulator [Trebonia sp.]
MMPPAAPVARRPGYLPAETTGFVGRKSELVMLSALLAGSRLVTVTGPGGVGKTRLALRAATAARARYRHGTVLAELSPLRDPELLPHTVASALGLPQQDVRPELDTITGYLRDRELLLILDTCEHVIDSAALFAEAVLSAAPRVTILATSRQPLDVTGENACPLAPLGVPDGARAHAADAAEPGAGDAVELFAQRAAAASEGFAVTANNRAEVIRLCRQLDGIPLAIELAAVRLRALDPGELGRLLEEHRLGILAGGRRGATPPRHQALRDAIGWSYELCTPAEQVLWARLSVFAGSFGVEAAEEVCAGGRLSHQEVLGALISLVDKSVVAKADDDRYRMLDTIRDYGAERLADSGEEDQVRRRLLRRYLRLAQEFDADPLTGQLHRYRALREEHASLRAALGYGFSVPAQARVAARLVTALYWYWHISGLIREGRHWLAVTLDQFPEPSVERAGALVLRGLATAAQGDPAAGVPDCEAGLAMATAVGDKRTYARGHLYYCQALLAAGRNEEAAAAGRAAASMMPAVGDAQSAEALHLYLGLLHLLAGDIDQALAVATRGLRRMPTDGGERWTTSFLCAVTGLCLFLTGETGRGSAVLRRSLSMRRDLGDPMGLAYGLGLLGFAAAGQSRYARAAWLLGAASPLWEQLGTAAFTGAPGLTQLAEQAAGDARENLGEDVYDELFTAAARRPLDEAVDLAIDDSDELPALTAGPASGPGSDSASGGSGGSGGPAAIGRPGLDDSGGPAAAGGSTAADGSGTRGAPLTEREIEIAGMVAGGLSNREIAERLVISRRTVDTHVAHIFGKAGVTSRDQLASWVRDRH